MILPSRLLRGQSSVPNSGDVGAGTVQPEENVASASLDSSAEAQLIVADEMELQYPEEAIDRPPIYVFTGHAWREPTPAEALAMTIPFQDPEEPERVQFGMGLRYCNGQMSPYIRTKNDDICVAPSHTMRVDTTTAVERDPIVRTDDGYCIDDGGTSASSTSDVVEVPETPVKRKSRKRPKSPPCSPATVASSTPSRKRKAVETPSASSPPAATKVRGRRSRDSNLYSIVESSDEPQAGTSTGRTYPDDTDCDDQVTLVGSSPEKQRSPPHKIRPPNSGGSSPLKPKASFAFAGYQCQMPGCCFTASSPQHIKHHYETFQHGRMTRQVAMRAEM